MKRYMKWLAPLFALLLCVMMALPASAEEEVPPLLDAADLFTPDEETFLLQKLDALREQYGFTAAVVTADDLGGEDPEAFADDCYDYFYGVNTDGALLLISMEPGNHYCHISTSGFGIKAMTDAGIDYMLDDIVDDHLADGDYIGGAQAFARLSDEFVRQAKTGEPYDVGHMPGEAKKGITAGKVFFWIILSFGIGLIAAAIRSASLTSAMKTVRAQTAANSYVKPGSMNVTNALEFFLYANVTRTARPSSSSSSGGSSTHMSSSGGTHGGGGRSF